jgi:hypothetical protein
MRIAGITLTALASASLVAGIAVVAADVHQMAGCTGGANPANACFASLTPYVDFPLLIGSTVLAGIGIPLLVVGGRRAGPDVAVGPRAVTVRWAF